MPINSRRKGSRAELALTRFLQGRGFAAKKVSGMYKRGPDLLLPLLGTDRSVEIKVRSNGFRELYAWLAGADFLIVGADRLEPLVVLPLKLGAEIAAIAERTQKNSAQADNAPAEFRRPTGTEGGPKS